MAQKQQDFVVYTDIVGSASYSPSMIQQKNDSLYHVIEERAKFYDIDTEKKIAEDTEGLLKKGVELQELFKTYYEFAILGLAQ